MFYTGKGDGGQSELFGSNKRDNKNEPIFDALGTVDELNSLLGICYAKSKFGVSDNHISVAELVREIQEDLFVLQAELARADKKISSARVINLEKIIDTLSPHTETPKGFVMAGSNELSAYFDFARSVARRAERAVLSVANETGVSKEVKAYLNRLSSVLYVLARYVATLADEKEQNPSYDTF